MVSSMESSHVLSLSPSHMQVVVIEQGRVVEQGTHDDLLAQGGVYKQLVLRQLMTGEPGNSLDAKS